MTKEQRELYDYFEHFWDDLKKNNKKTKVKDSGKETVKLLRELDFILNSLNGKKKKQSTHTRYSSSSKTQNCILKMHYVTDKNKHLAFLTEYMTQLNKKDIEEKPILFSDEAVDISFFENYRENATDLHFRFIISPENQDVDLRLASKSFIEKLNSLYAYNLHWIGAIHQNTEHKHSHILINGKDKNGRAVRFPKTFVKETGRRMIQNICTGLVGFRNNEEIQQKKEFEANLERYCSIDDELIAIEKRLRIPNEQFASFVTIRTKRQKERCEKLVALGLAKKTKEDENCYWLENNWTEKLHILGKYNVYKTARSKMQYVSSHNLELWDDSKPELDGIVTQLLYKDDEQNWCNACVVENKKLQKAYLIPFPGKMPEYKIFGQLVHCGKFISKKGRAYPRIQKIDMEVKR